MRSQIAWMLLGVLPLAQAAAVDRTGTPRAVMRRGFLDGLIGALTGENRNNNDNGNGEAKTVTEKETVTMTMMQTVTVNNAATGDAAGAPFGNQSTVTVTQLAAGGVAQGVSQLMIVTTTVFDGGAAPTVTITALASTVTQTVCNNNAVANPADSASAVDPNAQTPVIISGSTSNQGIVIVSLPGTTGPTTTLAVSTTAAEPAATSVVETSLAVPAETATSELSSLSSIAPIESVATSVDSSLAAPSVAVPTETAITSLLTQSLQPLPGAATTGTELASSLEATTSASAADPAAETGLSSSIALGLVGSTAPAAEQPAVTTAPAEVQNPAAGSALSLSSGISLASVLTLGVLSN